MLPDVSRESLKHYDVLLHKWQKAINLVGPSTLNDSWVRHFEDSLQLLPMIPDGARTLYDLGSGAGFPGMVIAIARPDLCVTLVESDQRKCAFLATVSHETDAKVAILNERIEKASESAPPPDIVTARALAPLSALLAYIRPWAESNHGLVCIFPKGAQAEAEIEAAQGIASFTVAKIPSLTESQAQILVLRNIIFSSQNN